MLLLIECFVFKLIEKTNSFVKKQEVDGLTLCKLIFTEIKKIIKLMIFNNSDNITSDPKILIGAIISCHSLKLLSRKMVKNLLNKKKETNRLFKKLKRLKRRTHWIKINHNLMKHKKLKIIKHHLRYLLRITLE